MLPQFQCELTVWSKDFWLEVLLTSVARSCQLTGLHCVELATWWKFGASLRHAVQVYVRSSTEYDCEKRIYVGSNVSIQPLVTVRTAPTFFPTALIMLHVLAGMHAPGQDPCRRILAASRRLMDFFAPQEG